MIVRWDHNMPGRRNPSESDNMIVIMKYDNGEQYIGPFDARYRFVNFNDNAKLCDSPYWEDRDLLIKEFKKLPIEVLERVRDKVFLVPVTIGPIRTDESGVTKSVEVNFNFSETVTVHDIYDEIVEGV